MQHLDLLLKHPDATLATYKRRQMKHLRYVFETLATYVYKKIDETLGMDACNIHVELLQHPNLLLQHPHEHMHLKQLKHLKHELATCLKKRPETQHHRKAMTYLVGNCGGAGSLDGTRPHARHARYHRLRERRRCRIWGGRRRIWN
jgi:hypothetical protein